MIKFLSFLFLFTSLVLGQRTEKVQYGDTLIDIHLAGHPLPNSYKPGSDSGRTELLDGYEIHLPGKRYLPIIYPSTLDDIVEEGGNERLLKRALEPGPLFGETGMPYWTDVKQNVNSCGLTSAIQSIARLIPELLAGNLFVEENSSATPSSVLVGVANWNVLPLVKLGVPVEKSSINSTNMMSGDIWWPGAFEKAIELLGQNTTFILSSRGMTMISGLSASFNLTTNSGLSTNQGATNKEETWDILIESSVTPITIQTFHNVTGSLQLNHIFTVLSAEEVDGVKTLTLHNPLGYDNVITYDKAWPQLYLYDCLTSFPTREDFGLGAIVESTPYVLVPPPREDEKGTTKPAKAAFNAVEQKGPAAPMDQISDAAAEEEEAVPGSPTPSVTPDNSDSRRPARTTTTTTTTIYISRQTATAGASGMKVTNFKPDDED